MMPFMLSYVPLRDTDRDQVWTAIRAGRSIAHVGWYSVGRTRGNARTRAPIGLHWFWRFGDLIFWADEEAVVKQELEAALASGALAMKHRLQALLIGREWADDLAHRHDDRRENDFPPLPAEFPGTPDQALAKTLDEPERQKRLMVPVILLAANARWRELLLHPNWARPFPS